MNGVPDMMTVAETAKAIRRSPRYVRRLIAAGGAETIPIRGGNRERKGRASMKPTTRYMSMSKELSIAQGFSA